MVQLKFVRTAASILIASLFAATLSAQIDDIPKVKTVDLAEMIRSSRSPIEVTATAVPASASINAPSVEWRGEEGREMARIAALPNIEISTNGNDLRTTLRTIFEKAEMKHFIQDDDAVMNSKVTLSLQNHPWEILKTLADSFGLEIVYRNGLWHCYIKNDQELVAKPYVLRSNTLERFKASTSSSSGGNKTAGNSSGVGSSVNIDRAGQGIFSVDEKALITEVEKFLGITGSSVVLSKNANLGTPGAVQAVRDSSGAAKGTVSFTADTNTLYVVATRAQHQLLEGWIREMDKPLKQIYLETKFFLTSINPTSQKGVSNSLTEDGFGFKLSDLSREVNPFRLNNYYFPKAIFSADDISARLQFVAKDSNTTTVQYPQQTTLSGREVVLRSITQVPIASSRNRDTGGSTTSTQTTMEYIDVGTVVSILPKVLDEKNIMLNISIQISSIAGTEMIDGNPYPKISTQTYNNQVIVEDGYTLALGGLEQSLNFNENSRVPGLGKVPFFGFLFKNESKSHSRSVLTMLVTPTIMKSYNGGNTSGIARHTTPARGTNSRSAFNPTPTSSIDDVNVSLVGFGDEVADIEQILSEGRMDSRVVQRSKLLLNELDLMEITINRHAIHGKTSPELLARIKGFRSRLNRALDGKTVATSL